VAVGSLSFEARDILFSAFNNICINNCSIEQPKQLGVPVASCFALS
jgi:hypothetical protein